MRQSIKILTLFLGFSIISFSQNMSFENQIRLAKSYEQTQNYDDAEKIYRDLLIQKPQAFNVYKGLLSVLLKTKKYDDAVSLINGQIAKNRQNIDLYGDLGSVYYIKGEENKAFETWNDGINIKPENPFSYRIIANYLIENRLIEKAIEILQKGNSKSADDHTIFSYDVANLYSLTMKFKEAAEEYCKIIKAKPKQINLIKNRILGYINSANAEKPTLEAVENFYENEKNVEYLKMLVDLYLRTNNFEKGLEAAKIVEEKTSKNGSYIFHFAQKISILGEHLISAKAYKVVIDEYPNSALLSQAEIGYPREIEYHLKKKFSKTEIWKKYGNPTYDKSEFYKLIEAYTHLAGKYTNDNVGIEAKYRIGIIFQEFLDNYSKADSIFMQIVQKNKFTEFEPKAEYHLAEINLHNNDLKTAENLLQKVINSRLSKTELLDNAKYLFAKTKMWEGNFTEAISQFNEVKKNTSDENTNDALQYLLVLNTFKKDSLNLFSFINADYLIEREKYKQAAKEFKKLADNKNLFILKDFAAVNYAELLLSLNNYKEAVIFLEEISNCDENNIYKDRFLYLLGASYFYGLNEADRASKTLAKIFEEFPNSIYSGKARAIISEIKTKEKENI